MNKAQLIKQLKGVGVLKSGSFVLHSGKVSEYYIDIKKAYQNPRILEALADALYGKIPKKATCIAASGYGGLPIASAISVKYYLPLALVRDAIKDHGDVAPIDGYVPKAKDMVAIVDDVFTTGASVRSIANILTENGATVLGAYVVASRSNNTPPFPLICLFEKKDLI